MKRFAIAALVAVTAFPVLRAQQAVPEIPFDSVPNFFKLPPDLNFGEDAGPSGSHAVAIEQALKRDFLAGEKLFCDSHNAAVAADEQGYSGNTAHHSGAVHPGGFERDAKGDAIALAKDLCAHGGHEKGKSTA